MLEIIKNNVNLIYKFINLSKNIKYFTYFQNHSIEESFSNNNCII
jgi:hypothetical protein